MLPTGERGSLPLSDRPACKGEIIKSYFRQTEMYDISMFLGSGPVGGDDRWYHHIPGKLFFLPPSTPLSLPIGSRGLPASYRALWASSWALSVGSRALSAVSWALSAGSETLPAGSESLPAGSEAHPAGSEAHPARSEALRALQLPQKLS